MAWLAEVVGVVLLAVVSWLLMRTSAVRREFAVEGKAAPSGIEGELGS